MKYVLVTSTTRTPASRAPANVEETFARYWSTSTMSFNIPKIPVWISRSMKAVFDMVNKEIGM